MSCTLRFICVRSSAVRALRATLLLLCFAVALQAQNRDQLIRVTLLHLNDVYQMSPIDKGKDSGLARVATLRKQVVAESPNTLFLLAGDTLSPSVASTVFKGEQMIALWNAVGLDYAVLGNHEFDFGDDVLVERMKESKFVWLGSNVIDRTTNRPFNNVPRYVIREIGGVKIGFFGLVTTDTATTSSPGPNLQFVDPIRTARMVVRRMRAEGARIIVAVTHLDLEVDKKLARTNLVDLILGGHDHELLQSQAGHAPILKWGQDARTLGRIDLNIFAKTCRLESIDWTGIPVTDQVPSDPTVAAIVAEYEAKLSTELDKPIGRTAVELDAREINVRNRETNLGNLLTDALRQATSSDVAIYNGGSIRSDMTYGPGELTKRDVISILPFEDLIVKVEISGATLRAALENSVSKVGVEIGSGGFLQVSGLQFEYDARRPAGSRVTKVTVGGQPLDDGKTYTLSASSYTIGGGDGYSMFKGVKFLIPEESAQIDSTILANAITAAGTVSPQIEGRIKRIDQ